MTHSPFVVEGDSFLHRLNPLSKIIAPFPIVIFVALTTEPWTPLTFILLTIVMLLGVGQIPLGHFLRIALPMSLIMLGYLLIYPLAVRSELVVNSPLLFRLGPITVYQAGLIFGLATGLRIYALLLLTLPFSLTTDATDFIRALVQNGRLPYRLGYGAMAAFRFVPLLRSELQVIQAAHRVRGVVDQGGIYAYFSQMQRYAIPLLATAIRQAERTALAMDGRAFGAFDTRTYYKETVFTYRDYCFIAVYWLVSLIAIIVLQQMGLLGDLVFLQSI